MENPVILITSTEEEGGGNGSKNFRRRKGECEGRNRWRSKPNEYKVLSDLGDFDNLKSMIQAEAFMRRKKRNRTKKRRKFGFCCDEYGIISDLSGFQNLKAMIEAETFIRSEKKKRKKGKFEFCVREDVTVNAPEDKDQLGKDEAVELVEVTKPESVQVLESNKNQNFLIDAANKLEDTGMTKAVEPTEGMGIGTDGGLISSQVTDLCLPSSENDRAISDVSCCRGVEDTVQAGAVQGVKKKRRRRKKTKRMMAKNNFLSGDWIQLNEGEEEDDVKDNIVLRMLLRKPRYFDPSDCDWVTCSSCGKENHTAASCKEQTRKKPCFLCGSFEHVWKFCGQATCITQQGQNCFIREGRDHLAKDCPETDQENNLSSNICLRCGDSGHNMFSCRGDYSTDDLKEIQCFVCKNFGHLCCVNFPDMAPK